MNVIVGKYSGFCAGVNYTYTKALYEVKKGPLYCLGEIIHNEHVISSLEDLGMITVSNIREIPDYSRVIFRAHGEPLSSYNYAKEHNLDVIDLTCGKVKVIHNKVLKEKNDRFILIIGKKNHPEIIGTVGFCDECFVIENSIDVKDAYNLFLKSDKSKVYVISQTTFSSSLFDKLLEEINGVFNDVDIKIDKSICDATEKRQKECDDLSKTVDLVIIIGSKKSSNTKELYDIAKNNCSLVYFLENFEDIYSISFEGVSSILVVAGASSPKYLIDDVNNYLNSL